LTALAAWGIGSTWTRGMQFVDDASVRDVDEPDLGDLVRVHERFGLRMSHADSFATERRRGWTETADTPPRDPGDAWDEARGDRIVMERVRPGSAEAERLTVRGTYAAIRELHGVRTDVRYEFHRRGGAETLHGVQWADWDMEGRLLVATEDGRLQIRQGSDETSTVWEADEGSIEPDPAPAPVDAASW
jgi:hypothetical protein